MQLENAAMQTSDLITDDEIRAAVGIYTVDPSDLNAAGHHLWGDRSVASDPEPADIDPRLLEIGLPSDDHRALLALIDRIERVKGKLPPDVAVLRKNLGS
jgi:hypothetical protein